MKANGALLFWAAIVLAIPIHVFVVVPLFWALCMVGVALLTAVHDFLRALCVAVRDFLRALCDLPSIAAAWFIKFYRDAGLL